MKLSGLAILSPNFLSHFFSEEKIKIPRIFSQSENGRGDGGGDGCGGDEAYGDKGSHHPPHCKYFILGRVLD